MGYTGLAMHNLEFALAQTSHVDRTKVEITVVAAQTNGDV